ncbi:hypothetical protein M513_14341, partial [Trichuris suis]
GPVGAALFSQRGYDRQASRKCCITKVAYDCTARMEESHEVNKPGKCPAEATIAKKAHFCRSDKDCEGSEECYAAKAGLECEEHLQK